MVRTTTRSRSAFLPRSQQSIYMYAEAPISWSFRTLLMLTTAMPQIACLPKCAWSFGSRGIGNCRVVENRSSGSALKVEVVASLLNGHGAWSTFNQNNVVGMGVVERIAFADRMLQQNLEGLAHPGLLLREPALWLLAWMLAAAVTQVYRQRPPGQVPGRHDEGQRRRPDWHNQGAAGGTSGL